MPKLIVPRIYWLIVVHRSSTAEQVLGFPGINADDARALAQRKGYATIAIHRVQ